MCTPSNASTVWRSRVCPSAPQRANISIDAPFTMSDASPLQSQNLWPSPPGTPMCTPMNAATTAWRHQVCPPAPPRPGLGLQLSPTAITGLTNARTFPCSPSSVVAPEPQRTMSLQSLAGGDVVGSSPRPAPAVTPSHVAQSIGRPTFSPFFADAAGSGAYFAPFGMQEEEVPAVNLKGMPGSSDDQCMVEPPAWSRHSGA